MLKYAYNWDGIVDFGIGKEIRSQSLLLNFATEHQSDFISFVEQVPHFGVHFLIDDKVSAFLPVSVTHCFRGCHHMFSHGFWRSDQSLSFARSKIQMRKKIQLNVFTRKTNSWRKNLAEHFLQPRTQPLKLKEAFKNEIFSYLSCW